MNHDNTIISITGSLSEFLDRLPELGTVFVQTRSHCGGLGKFLNLNTIYFDSEEKVLSSPETGMLIDLSEMVAIFAEVPDDTSQIARLEFDFFNRPSGLTFMLMPSISEMATFHQLIKIHFGGEVDPEDLSDLRDELLGSDNRCPCCQEAGKNRQQNVSKHPLYEIVSSLKETSVTGHIRHRASHVDLTGWVRPESISIQNGHLLVTDHCGTVVTINFDHLHALAMKNLRFDGAESSSLNILDTYGNCQIEWVVEDPEIIHHWKQICHRSHTSDK
ncbi:MAG: hypothetical protein AAF226_00640 [Verrucomicrobiota bacterium]